MDVRGCFALFKINKNIILLCHYYVDICIGLAHHHHLIIINMDLFETLGQALDPKNGIDQPVKKENTPSYFPLAMKYRNELREIGKSIDVNLNSLFALCSPQQILDVIVQHSDVVWSNPYKNGTMRLISIKKEMDSKWYLGFDNERAYQLNELYTEEALNLMETIEGIIVP
jgi:hypothetical protein